MQSWGSKAGQSATRLILPPILCILSHLSPARSQDRGAGQISRETVVFLFIPCLLLLSLVSLYLHGSTSHDNSYLAGELEVPLRPAGQPGSSVLGYVVWGFAHIHAVRSRCT